MVSWGASPLSWEVQGLASVWSCLCPGEAQDQGWGLLCYSCIVVMFPNSSINPVCARPPSSLLILIPTQITVALIPALGSQRWPPVQCCGCPGHPAVQLVVVF